MTDPLASGMWQGRRDRTRYARGDRGETAAAWRGRWAAGLLLAWLALGAGRMLELAVHRPVFAYADSYDMLRLFAGYGLWPADGLRGLNHPAGPWRRYVFADFTSACAMPSSQMLLHSPAVTAMAAVNRWRPGTLFDVRAIGLSQALLAVLVAAGASWHFWRRGRPGIALANALLFALLVCDPINTLFLNGFYCHWSSVFFCYVALVAAASATLAGPSLARGAWVALGLGLLGISKQQHLPTMLLLAGGLLATDWAIRRRFPARLALAMALAAGVSAAAAWAIIGRHDIGSEQVQRCNWQDTVFNGVLPLSHNPLRVLARLGLPPRCLELRGSAFGDPRAAMLPEEFFHLSRLRLVAIFCDEPALPWRIFHRGLEELERAPTIRLTDLGEVEDAPHATAPRASLADPLARLGPWPRKFLWRFPAVLALFYAARAIAQLRRGQPADLGLLLCVLPLTAYAMLFLFVLADGFVSHVHHNHLTINLLLATYVLTAAHAVGALGRVICPYAPRPALAAASNARAIAAAAVLLGCVTLLAVLAWNESEPPVSWNPDRVLRDAGTCGSIETVTPLDAQTCSVSGWAYDPHTGGSARRIVLVCDGHVLPVHVFQGPSRGDVNAARHLPPDVSTGWTAAVPRWQLPNPAALAAYVVLADGRFAPLCGPVLLPRNDSPAQ